MNVILAHLQKHYFQICYIRQKVFVEEQNVSLEEEFDQEDFNCAHFLLYKDNQPIGCCRLIENEDYFKIGRLAVLSEFRHQGGATALLKKAEEVVKEKDGKVIKIAAQVNAQQLYLKNGYIPYGELFLDANIQHIMMEKKICD